MQPSFENAALQREIMKLRQLDDVTNCLPGDGVLLLDRGDRNQQLHSRIFEPVGV